MDEDDLNNFLEKVEDHNEKYTITYKDQVIRSFKTTSDEQAQATMSRLCDEIIIQNDLSKTGCIRVGIWRLFNLKKQEIMKTKIRY